MNPSLKLNESMELPYMFKNNILNIRKFITSERLKESFKLHTIVHSVSIYWMPSMLEGNGTPLQYSCLENPMDGGAWRAVVHGVTGRRTPLSDFTFTFHFHALEKEMAPHSSTLVWKIPWTEEPGGLQSMGSHRVGHDWATSLSLFTFTHWRRQWQPTAVFLPGESQGFVCSFTCKL